LSSVVIVAAENLLGAGKFFTPCARIHATNFLRACLERRRLRGAKGTSAVLVGNLERPVFAVFEALFEESPHPAITMVSRSRSKAPAAVIDLDVLAIISSLGCWSNHNELSRSIS